MTIGETIQRYGREKEAVTHIAEEPWHFRYVGVPHALLMEQNRLCLEEYVPFLQSGVKICRLSNGRTARVSWLPCPGEEIQTEVPEGCWQVSGDNQGGFILTLWEGGLCVDIVSPPPWTGSACWPLFWWCATTPPPWTPSRRGRTSGSPGCWPGWPSPSSSWSAGIFSPKKIGRTRGNF